MAYDIAILTETDLREIVKLDLRAVNIVERAFSSLAGGNVVMPPILSMKIEDANGEIDIKTAYIPGFNSFAIKVSPGVFNNPGIGLASLNGLMILFSAKTGLIDALLLDNGYLTDIRTAAAGAVAARHLAPQAVNTAGVMDTGAQARLQIEALALGRTDLYVADRVSQCELLGELRSARLAGFLTGATPPELGDIICAKHPGRQSNNDVTICDLTGTGAQDTAIANFAFNTTQQANVGRTIST